jgi:hypothetical protein
MSRFDCEFCNSSFSSKGNLTLHKKTAKKCLLLQGNFNEIKTKTFTCNICDTIYLSNKSLKEHSKKCFVDVNKFLELKKQLESKDIQIKDLQDKLANIAEIGAKKHTTNNYTNITNQLAPYDLNREKIYAIVNEYFTEDHLYARENGIANFAVNNLLTNDEGQIKMTCTDTSRKIFAYKDKDGKIYKDPNATGFLDTYIPAVKRKSYQIISDKDGTEMIELTECVMTIEPTILSNKLAGKLTIKP